MRKKTNATNRARRICCVLGCRNSEHRNPELHFYTFPGRPWEEGRKNNWIAAARLTSTRNKGWTPSGHTRICSAHFAGGEKTNDPRKEAYNPTIFPWNAYAQAQKRTAELQNVYSSETVCSSSVIIPHAPPDAVIQTDLPKIASWEKAPDSLFCWQNSVVPNDSAQTIVASTVHQQKPIKEEMCFVSPEIAKSARDSFTNSDNGINLGFSGFKDVEDDETMNQLCGVSQTFFAILLNILPENPLGGNKIFKNVSRENSLLIFLMKMKLALSFATLGSLFKVSEEMTSRIFFSVLTMLYSQTKSWIFWQPKEAIKKGIPATFTHYPNCRAIINCTEIRCEDPSEIEKRVFMYSPCTDQFAAKYLIALSTSGLITFLSKGYGGRTTNEYIATDSGFLNLLEPEDEILADKDYPKIKEELLKRQCALIEPYLELQSIGKHISEHYLSVRLMVENAIQKIKMYKILENVNAELLPYIDEIMSVACILANNK